MRAGARVAGDVWAIFEYAEPRGTHLPSWLDMDVPDDQFIASTLPLQSAHPGSTLVVATGDLNLKTNLPRLDCRFWSFRADLHRRSRRVGPTPWEPDTDAAR